MIKVLYFLLILLSLLLAFIGLGFIAMYIWEGIILRLGEPDQSLIFWYLPLLFIGLLGFASGIALFIFAYQKLKQ